MKAIILVAGKGARLAHGAQDKPKCLLDFQGKTLLDFQLQALNAVGIRDIVLVTGYRKEKIREHLAQYPDCAFTTLVNPDYSVTNTAVSLWMTRDYMNDDFIYLNGDVLFHPELIHRLAHTHNNNALAVVRKQCGVEEVKVVLRDARIAAIGKEIDPLSAYGEFIGIAKFAGDMCPDFVTALGSVIDRPGGRMMFFEAALAEIVQKQELTAVDITDIPCIEIDFPEDLEEARNSVLPKIVPAEKEKTKILFYVERNLHLPFLEPVHDYISAHYDVDCAFAAPPYVIPQGGRVGHGIDPATRARLQRKARFVKRPEDFAADIAVVADSCYYAVRHAGQIVTVGHGMISKGWFYTEAPPSRRENCADVVCVPGEWHKDILRKNVTKPIVVTGFIKSDALYAMQHRPHTSFDDTYSIAEHQRVLLFAPTFNPEFSAVPCIGDRIVELSDSNTVLLVKLHGMTDKAWVDEYHRIAAEHSMVKLVSDADFAEAMVRADVLISDVSSVVVECMLLDKPVVVYNNPRRFAYPQYDPENIEYKVRDAALQVSTIEELKNAVMQSLQFPEALAPLRRQYANKLNYALDGKAAGRAAAAVMQAAHGSLLAQADTNLYSIIVPWEYVPERETVADLLHEIKTNADGSMYEVICAGKKPLQIESWGFDIAAWIDEDHGVTRPVQTACSQSVGDYIVLLDPAAGLRPGWLQRMQRYFKWHADAGAVKALHERDGWRRLLENIPEQQQPATPKEAAEYFEYFMIGNDVPVQGISSRDGCVMLKRAALDAVQGSVMGIVSNDPLSDLGRLLSDSGYSMWHAIDVLVYCRSSEPHKSSGTAFETGDDIRELYNNAMQCKSDKKFQDAIMLLERAEKQFAEADVDGAQADWEDISRLYWQSRQMKKKKQYQESIKLLEVAKKKIA